MAATESNAIFDDNIEVRSLSSSQKEIITDCPFLGAIDGSSLSSREIPVDSTGIVMASLPDTAQETAKDKSSQEVFHTPPEQQSSLSASDGFGRPINKAAETDDETQGFFDFCENVEAITECVDLRDDSQLGFLKQGNETTLVAECLDCNDGSRKIEISRSGIDEFRISKRELPLKDGSGEAPRKEGIYESEKGTDEGNKIGNNENAETFEREKGGEERPESSVFPSSIIDILKKIGEMKNEVRDHDNFMFDVFKAISKEDPVDDSLENVSFLELARRKGFEFPRPFWWPDDDNKMN